MITIGMSTLLMLTACNANNNANEATDVGFTPRDTYTQNVRNNDAGQTRPGAYGTTQRGNQQYGGHGRYGVLQHGQGQANQGQNNNLQDQARNIINQHLKDLPRDGVVKINHGVITIDPNSYSTSTPSGKYPHSKYINKGQFEFYDPGKEGAGEAPKTQQPTGQQPSGGGQAPSGGQENVQTPAQQPQQTTPEQPAEQATPSTSPSTQGISGVESRVIELTNAERRKNGLLDLKADASLSNVAREKSKDMQQNKYFSHTSPTYGSPFDMMRDFGISYKSAGENIAQGQRTPEEVVNAWMNSEGHRKNILSSGYTHIGVGYVESGHYWTQMFISK